MALPTATTLTGSLVSIGGIDIADHIPTMSFVPKRETPSINTFGGQVSAAGSLSGSGTIECVYDNAASTGYSLLMAELMSPTDGGIECIFEPEGTAAGNERWKFNIIVGQGDLGGAAADIVVVPFPYVTTGSITQSTQS